jgi:hypothetical protein
VPNVPTGARTLSDGSRTPDLALAVAHAVADDFARRGHADAEVRAESWVSFNGRRCASDPG